MSYKRLPNCVSTQIMTINGLKTMSLCMVWENFPPLTHILEGPNRCYSVTTFVYMYLNLRKTRKNSRLNKPRKPHCKATASEPRENMADQYQNQRDSSLCSRTIFLLWVTKVRATAHKRLISQRVKRSVQTKRIKLCTTRH